MFATGGAGRGRWGGGERNKKAKKAEKRQSQTPSADKKGEKKRRNLRTPLPD